MTKQLEDSIITEDCRKLRRVLMKMTKIKGWHEVYPLLYSRIKGLLGNRWFAINRLILGAFQAEELVGYEGDVLELARIQHENEIAEFSEVCSYVLNRLIKRVEDQLENGGSTLFFDASLMESRKSAVLIDSLAKARRKEFLTELSKMIENGVFDGASFPYHQMKGLNRTYYGRNLLTEAYGRSDSFRAIINGEFRSGNLEVDYWRALFTKVLGHLDCRWDDLASIENDAEYGSDCHPHCIGELADEIFYLAGTRYGKAMLLESGYFSGLAIIENLLDESMIIHNASAIWSTPSDECEPWVSQELGKPYRDEMMIIFVTIRDLATRNHPKRITLLRKILQIPFDYYLFNVEYGDEIKHPHSVVLETMKREYEVSKHLSSIVAYLKHLRCNIGDKYCRSSYPHIYGSSLEAFEIACDVASQNSNQALVTKKLKEFMRCMLWSDQIQGDRDSGQKFLDILVNHLGKDAAPLLLDHLIWPDHCGYCGGSSIDRDVYSKLIHMGHDIAPLVLKKLEEDGGHYYSDYVEGEWGINLGCIRFLSQFDEYHRDILESVICKLDRISPDLFGHIFSFVPLPNNTLLANILSSGIIDSFLLERIYQITRFSRSTLSENISPDELLDSILPKETLTSEGEKVGFIERIRPLLLVYITHFLQDEKTLKKFNREY